MPPILPMLFATAAAALAAPAQTAAAGLGEDEDPVRVAAIAFARPEDNRRILEATKKALEPLFKTRGLEIKVYTFDAFEREAVSPKTDLILSTAGHVRRLAHKGVQPVATIVAHPGADANRSEGTAVVVRIDRDDLQTLGDLRGCTVAANNPLGFTGWQIVLGEVAKFGVEAPQDFFGRTIFTGDSRSTDAIAQLVLAGAADAGFLRLCAYEQFLRRHPEADGAMRVLGAREQTVVSCAHSTDLYPGFTFAVTERIRPELARRIALALYSMPPTATGVRWAVPANFQKVDLLLQTLEVGPWAHLSESSIKKLVLRNLPWVLLGVVMLLGLLLHGWRAEVVARRRGERVRELMVKDMMQVERLAQLQREGAMVQLANLFAHEVRQPLACASLYAEGLARQIRRGGADLGRLAGIADKIADETERASEIVDYLRGYVKGRGHEKRRLDAGRLMEDSVRLWRIYTPRSMPVELVLPPADTEVTGSEFELEVVFLNLLKNAREAMMGASTPLIRFEGAAREGAVEFVVTDAGRPPSDETLARLGAAAPSTKADGLGLGLSIAANLVEGHGGAMTFARGPGGRLTGLSVHVTLPAAPEDEGADAR